MPKYPPEKEGALRRLEINGGRVEGLRPYGQAGLKLRLPISQHGYADAQIDDYGGQRRSAYRWRPGTRLRLQARFSHEESQLVGTAGFGFWNAPFGDPTVPWPALPQAVWFFFGSEPTDLPLAKGGPGRGWFAATLDAATLRAVRLIPLAPVVLLLNQSAKLRQKVWPWVQQQLQISFQPLEMRLTDWHEYQLDWHPTGCEFWFDGRLIHQTNHSPRGPLGFVCWLDNQYLVATAVGRFRWGTLPVEQPQWLEISGLEVGQID